MRTRLLLLLLFLAALSLGLAGIDFGYHWDEIKLIRSVRAAYREKNPLLPGWYNYPSLSYDLTLLSSLPEAWQVFRQQRGQAPLNPLAFWQAARELYRPINARLEPSLFPPRMRPLFLLLTLGSAVWVYLLARDFWRSRRAGLLACALLLGSWEFAYHARWGAPDGLLTSFGLLAVWLALRGWREKSPGWLFLSAAAAALAAGSKYYGGLFLLPAAAALLGQKKPQWLLPLGLLFAALFLLSTPGLALEPAAFWRDVQAEMRHYATSHFGQTVSPGLEHWLLLSGWLSLQGLSPFAPLAAPLFALALGGLWAARRLPRAETALVLGVPALQIAYLGLQRVLIVRNDLALLPFLALLTAGGVQALWRSAPLQAAAWKRAGLTAALLLALALNFGWQVYAAQSIRARGQNSLAACLQATLQTRPQTRFLLSPQARALLGNAAPPNQVHSSEEAEVFLYISGEIKHPLTANRPFFYEIPCGPYEINFSYYPDWEGDPRLVATRMENMRYERLTREK